MVMSAFPNPATIFSNFARRASGPTSIMKDCTAALKGDYTRTGERGVAGMMRDGVSSVTRMYINVFRDTYRQAAIDIMQNVELDLAAIREEREEELEFVPALISVASVLLPPSPIPPKNKSWVVQEWPSGEGKVVTLTPEQLVSIG
eukprot:sb/3473845/